MPWEVYLDYSDSFFAHPYSPQQQKPSSLLYFFAQAEIIFAHILVSLRVP